MANTVNVFVETLRTVESWTNERGNAVHRAHLNYERYVVDFADDFSTGGWQQFDTDQDAPYFGVWLNREKMLTLTCCEGDWTLVVCPDPEHYLAEVEDAIRFYGDGQIATVIDLSGDATVYQQDRAQFLAPLDQEE